MQVVILAGGRGTRLRSLTNQLPKSLVKIHGLPFIQYQFNWLARYNLREVVLCVGHLADQIKSFAGDGRSFGIRIAYSVEEDRLLGTAGALKNAEMLLDEKFCVLNGDSYLPTSPLDPIRSFEQGKFAAMMLTFRNLGKYDHSNVSIQNGLVTTYNRNDPTCALEFIDYGMTAFKKEVLELIPPHDFVNLDSLYLRLIAQRDLAAYMIHEPFHEIGSVRGLARFTHYVERERL
jgi:N-acetyl-alpha-D-muramate 1-phosphate uridylyltransferase